MLTPQDVFERSVACWLFLSLVLVALPVPASARAFMNPIHETVDVTDAEYWEGIAVKSSEKLSIRVQVEKGAEVHISVVAQDDLTGALANPRSKSIENSSDTRSYSFTLIRQGTFAVVVRTTGTFSRCAVDIEVSEATFFERVAMPIIIIVVIAVACVGSVLTWKWIGKSGTTVTTKEAGLQGLSLDVTTERIWVTKERKYEKSFGASYAFCTTCSSYVKGETGKPCPRCGKTL